MLDQQFSVRAMPPAGFSRRFRAGRPWGKDPVSVKVVETPAPNRIDQDVHGNKYVTYSNEITPKDLELIVADTHFSVSPIGAGSETDPLQINATKAAAISLAADLEKAKLEIAGLSEDAKRFRVVSMKEAEEKATKIAKLEQ